MNQAVIFNRGDRFGFGDTDVTDNNPDSSILYPDSMSASGGGKTPCGCKGKQGGEIGGVIADNPILAVGVAFALGYWFSTRK
jgi:hypothetical protein